MILTLTRSLSKQKNLFITLFLCLLLFFSNTQDGFATTASDLKSANSTIVEYLRISVSNGDRKAWLIAEQESWAPWLEKQKGFLGRKLFWDREKEEAILLISWASRADWKSIPQEEIDSVQEVFVQTANNLTGKNLTNPFPVKSEGELLPQ